MMLRLADDRDRIAGEHRLGLHVTTSEALVADPAGAARAALDHLPPGPLALHIDVDVLACHRQSRACAGR
jgi:hypothetical protein